jgi:hypothetical protein
MILYRPVGMKELELIFETNMKAFPPRLPEQPIFYPVLNYPYAKKIARDWNTKSNTYAGYVTKFEVNEEYIKQFEPQVVGENWHAELWIPAEDLTEFNHQIKPPILVVGAYFGQKFSGEIPKTGRLKALGVVEQLATLCLLSSADLPQEVKINKLAIFLNFAFWLRQALSEEQRNTLSKISELWEKLFPAIPLPTLNE